jgi:hypothetical protein
MTEALSRQRCAHHGNREAVARCPECRRFFCRECVVEHDGRALCASCLKRLSRGAGARSLRFPGVLRFAQALAGLVVGGCFFYLIGKALLSIPTAFHDGTVWKADPGEFE